MADCAGWHDARRANADNDIVLPDHRVSRYHTKLIDREGAYWLADLDSANGAFVGEQILRPREPMAIADQDEIRLAATRLLFRQRGEEPSRQLAV